MKKRCEVKITARVFGFYDPDQESVKEAEDRIGLTIEMAANASGEIRMHLGTCTIVRTAPEEAG